MTDLAKLKKGKGAPPPADITPDVIAANDRQEEEDSRALQVRIPSSVFDAFSETAMREFGYSKGAKKQLFLKMWEAYSQNR